MLIVVNSFRILELFFCVASTPVISVLCMRDKQCGGLVFAVWIVTVCLGYNESIVFLFCIFCCCVSWFWFCYTFQIAVFFTLVMWYKLTKPVIKFLNGIPTAHCIQQKNRLAALRSQWSDQLWLPDICCFRKKGLFEFQQQITNVWEFFFFLNRVHICFERRFVRSMSFDRTS